MFGEYALYSCGKVFGGIYDNRLMIKITDIGIIVIVQEGFSGSQGIVFSGSCQAPLP